MDGAQIIKNAVDPYWFFANEISKDTCQKIIDLGKKKWKKATVQTNFNSENQYDEKQRITDIAWCNERWVYDLVWHYLEVANQNSNWNFQIDSCESMQIARYKKNGHFIFHQDGNGFTRFNNNNEFTHGKTRKLSMSIILNDEFDGGEFEFHNKGKVESKRGTVIVFPSYMVHRVKPITKGTRYSLVAWFCGEPFV